MVRPNGSSAPSAKLPCKEVRRNRRPRWPTSCAAGANLCRAMVGAAEALAPRQGRGEHHCHTVRVEHVTVQAVGQAIVGAVAGGGAGTAATGLRGPLLAPGAPLPGMLAELIPAALSDDRSRPRLCENTIALVRRARSRRKAVGVGNDGSQQTCTAQRNCWLPLRHGVFTQPAPNSNSGVGIKC